MIELPSRFDDLRPYYDSEVPAAMQRIAADPLLRDVLAFLGKEDMLQQVRQILSGINTTDEFQKTVMVPLFNEIVRRTVTSFTTQGAENAGCKTGRLFVSNHRDIVMDSCFQQSILVANGIPTSHITFGSNLMDPQFVVDIGLSNKMFKTVRKVAEFRSFLEDSTHLSDYINYVVSHGESLWIAQRNGRTKDGCDKTDPGLLRMLLLGGDKLSALKELHITPVSISYQWEPCDELKAVELYRSLDGKPYVKAKGEDLHSIVTGITSQKGNVHVAICPEVDASRFSGTLRRSDMQDVVREMDEKIYAGYRLWDTNFAAFDILHSSSCFTGLYSAALKDEFESRLEKMLESHKEMDRGVLRSIYLKIYAGPVSNSPDYCNELSH